VEGLDETRARLASDVSAPKLVPTRELAALYHLHYLLVLHHTCLEQLSALLTQRTLKSGAASLNYRYSCGTVSVCLSGSRSVIQQL